MSWDDVFPLHFVILGRPCSWKNQKRVVRCGGFPKVLPSKRSEVWMDSAVSQLRAMWHEPPLPADLELNAAVVSYLGTRHRIDADNLYGGPGDALERAGILENDFCIGSHDGSRRRYDKYNPRVEITLTLAAEPSQAELFEGD